MALGFLAKAHAYLLVLGGAYGAFLLALTIPSVQRSLLYMNWVNWPIPADYAHPEKYGLAVHRVRNFYLTTPDGETLGAWQALPASIYTEYVEKNGLSKPIPEEVFDQALRDPNHKTLIYCHGNSAARMTGHRRWTNRMVSTALDHNFIIFDYRGFGDSTGVPSQEGLLTDARTVWDYVTVEKGVPSEKVGLMGQSLGTGVAAGFASRLAKEGIRPQAVILVAAYSSISNLLLTYRLFKFLPILAPLGTIPHAQRMLLGFLQTRFDTLSVLRTVRSPILLIHALDDMDIPTSHSHSLFDTLLDPLLPPVEHSAALDPSSTALPKALLKLNKEQWAEFQKTVEARQTTTARLVSEEKLGEYGRSKRFVRAGSGVDAYPDPVKAEVAGVLGTDGQDVGIQHWGDVTLLEAASGGHNSVGYSDTAVLFIGQAMKA